MAPYTNAYHANNYSANIANPYFNYFQNDSEQGLLSDLLVESISVYGYNFYYLPRRYGNRDVILSQDDMSFFDTAYLLVMYIKNVEGFAGEGQYLSKFGLDIRDRITLTIARKTFNNVVGGKENLLRPQEGDLIYFAMTNKIWEIKQSDPWFDFYPLGSLPMFDLSCDVFQYDNEHFATGIAAIDAIETNYSTNVEDYWEFHANGSPILDANDNPIINASFDINELDPEFDNFNANTTIDPLIDRTSVDPISRGLY